MLITLTAVTAVFILAQVRRDNSVMDIFYGPIFALSYWLTLWLTDAVAPITLSIGALLTIWALRLGIRIGRKNWSAPEDPRYATWRVAWNTYGPLYFLIRSYIQINLLQGLIITLIATPLWLMLAQSNTPLTWLVWVGAAISLLGIAYEATADWQLDRFIAGKKAGTESATLMTRGLFTYSRRPNYFGETLVWWGFAVIALSSGLSAWPVFIAPLLITYILYNVTGSLLERYFWDTYPEAYQQYVRNTPNFILPNFFNCSS